MDGFYKEHYFYEINRKQQIVSSLTIPIGILIVLSGAMTLFLRCLTSDGAPVMAAFRILVSVALASLGMTIYYLIRSYFGFAYDYVSDTQDVLDFEKGLKSYYEKIGRGDSASDDALKEVKEFVRDQYARCCQINAENNDSRSEFVHRANGFLIMSLVSVIMCAAPYFVTERNKPDTVYSVKLVEHRFPEKEPKMSDKEKPAPTVPPATTVNPQNPAAPASLSVPMQSQHPEVVKPTPPSIKTIKEGEQRPKSKK
jgi:hypothetical protein